MIGQIALCLVGGIAGAAGMAVLFEAIAVRWFHPVAAINAAAEHDAPR